jgi:hypothetical protein
LVQPNKHHTKIYKEISVQRFYSFHYSLLNNIEDRAFSSLHFSAR